MVWFEKINSVGTFCTPFIMTADKEPETDERKPSFTSVNQVSDHSDHSDHKLCTRRSSLLSLLNDLPSALACC